MIEINVAYSQGKGFFRWLELFWYFYKSLIGWFRLTESKISNQNYITLSFIVLSLEIPGDS